MRKLNCLLLLALIVLALAISLAMTFRQPVKGSIAGYVLDDSGPPIARASVQAFNIMHGGFSTTVSQPNGFYQILDLDAGKYSLWVESKGYSSEWIPVLIVEDGQVTRKDIRLRRELPTDEVH